MFGQTYLNLPRSSRTVSQIDEFWCFFRQITLDLHNVFSHNQEGVTTYLI